jgi:uncharacterized protein YqhQ
MSLTVGGQAVIEGVMMRTPRAMTVSVRRRDGSIEVHETTWRSVADAARFLRWPIFRGGLVLYESMLNGLSSMRWSAERVMLDEAEASGEPVAASESGGLTAAMAVSLLLSFGLFVAVPHLVTLFFGRVLGVSALDGTSVAFHLTVGATKIAIFLSYLTLLSRQPDIRRVFEYHGAEHKAIFAWEAGQELTIPNAQSHTRLHPRCGTSFLFIVVIASILVFTVFFRLVSLPLPPGAWTQAAMIALKLPLLFPIAGIAYEFQRLSAKSPDAWYIKPLIWPGLMLQKITTQEPDDEQVEVALASLKSALAREELLRAGSDAGPERVHRVSSLSELPGAPVAA